MSNASCLALAARVFARVMRAMAISVMHSDETAAAVNIQSAGPNFIDVNAGHETGPPHDDGPWGWAPIQAYMFETGSKHPLFGNEAHQYHQPYRPILEKTENAGALEAARVYGDARIAEMVREFGYY